MGEIDWSALACAVCGWFLGYTMCLDRHGITERLLNERRAPAEGDETK